MTPSSSFPRLALGFLLLLAFTGCGGGSMSNSTMSNATRMMQTLMVTPSSADAQNSPGSKVQFTATGTFNMAPMTVKSPPVVWSIGSPFPPAQPPMMGMSMTTPMSPTASVDGNGVAQCNGFMGMVTVQATAPIDPSVPISQMSAMMGTVSGTAQLTCP
jgi:hypothetical protein